MKKVMVVVVVEGMISVDLRDDVNESFQQAE